MPYRPLKDPAPADGDVVATEVMDALDFAMPIIPQPQNYNGPYPQGNDIKRGYNYEGVTEKVLADQYIRAAKFYGGGSPDQNSAARTAAFVQNHSNSELVARWCSIHGADPITAEYLGISDEIPPPVAPAPPASPIHEVNAALSAANSALVALNAAVQKLN